jgi:hypothetical protein
LSSSKQIWVNLSPSLSYSSILLTIFSFYSHVGSSYDLFFLNFSLSPLHPIFSWNPIHPILKNHPVFGLSFPTFPASFIFFTMILLSTWLFLLSFPHQLRSPDKLQSENETTEMLGVIDLGHPETKIHIPSYVAKSAASAASASAKVAHADRLMVDGGEGGW